jgi:hypothetical protein
MRKRMDAYLRECRRIANATKRAEIRALSDRDIQKMMARVIIGAAIERGCVIMKDFFNKGLPEHRLKKNKDAAFRLARRIYPKLDEIGDMPWAA